MYITTLSGQTEMLIDFYDVSIYHELSKEHTLEFSIVKTEYNKYVYDMVQSDAIIDVDGLEFGIKIVEENPYYKTVYATDTFFDNINCYVEETFPNGTYNIVEALDLAFSTSTWTYELADSYPQRAGLEEYGNDNALSMFNKVLRAFNSEYELDRQNQKVIIKRMIGVQTDYQIRYKTNLTAINKTVDSSNVRTAIKVFYNLDEFGNYNSSIIYRSPNESKYPQTRWASPVLSDVITTQAQAVSTARLVLDDEPNINIEVEFAALQEAGYNSDDIKIGNSLYLIDERMEIDATARITAIKTFPYEPGLTPQVTISSIKKSISSMLVNQQTKQATIEQSAVKLKSIYNGCTISKEEGFKAIAENGVETIMNATEGIMVKRNGDLKFFVDANNDELTMDGRLKVTSGGHTLLEGFKDNAGGILKIYDNDDFLNVEIGSNKFDTYQTGGVLNLYEDGTGVLDVRVNLGIDRPTGSGNAAFNNGSGETKIRLEAENSYYNTPLIQLDGADSQADTSQMTNDFFQVSGTTTFSKLTNDDLIFGGRSLNQQLQNIWDYINNL